MIREEDIDQILQEVSDDEDGVLLNTFIDRQQPFVQYLTSEAFNALSPEERDILLFVNMIVYHAVTRHREVQLDMSDYERIEEANWSKVNNEMPNKSWGEKLDLFFEDYPEEDLLSFVEDMTIADEEDRITEIGRECVFVTAKSYIDCITGPSKSKPAHL